MSFQDHNISQVDESSFDTNTNSSLTKTLMKVEIVRIELGFRIPSLSTFQDKYL